MSDHADADSALLALLRRWVQTSPRPTTGASSSSAVRDGSVAQLPNDQPRATPRWLHAMAGAILFTLASGVALELGAGAVPLLRSEWTPLLLAGVGLVIGLTPARRLLWAVATLVAATFLVVS